MYQLPGYSNFTTDNFFVIYSNSGTYSWGASDDRYSGGYVNSASIGYNNSTGVVSVSQIFGGTSQRNFGPGSVTVYLVYVS